MTRHVQVLDLEVFPNYFDAALLGVDLTKARAYLYGHYYACEPCARALRDAGVMQLYIKVKR